MLGFYPNNKYTFFLRISNLNNLSLPKIFVTMRVKQIISTLVLAVCTVGCIKGHVEDNQTLPIISWGGIPASKADTLYSLAKECGFDTHLGLYSTQRNALISMDAAERAGIGIIISFPQIKDSTEKAVELIKGHPALAAYHLKDEPDTSDFPWLKLLCKKISSIDPCHPCYINLLPNWSWGVEEYASKIESYASGFDVPFYSFDHYPIIEEDGQLRLRPEWYRNLEEFSQMASRHGKPFWAFALATSHSIVVPEVAHYPEPDLGQLRLQVFSNLLYGAQAIQYFNFLGLVDPVTCQKKPAFDLIRQVNSEIKAYSSVFAGCSVRGVWHTGESIPSGTHRMESMPHKKVSCLSVTGEGAVISLLENAGETYLAIQNRDFQNVATLEIAFNSRVDTVGLSGTSRFDGKPIELAPGNIAIFRLS